MIKGFRLEAQTAMERTSRTVKPVLEYTAGDISDKNIKFWMTDKAPNADSLTREGDQFDLALKNSKKIMTLSVPEKYMSLGSLNEKQYIEAFRIRWYSTESGGVDDYWRLIIFHHVTVKRATIRDFRSATTNTSYYEVVMKIDADIEYLDKYGSKAQ